MTRTVRSLLARTSGYIKTSSSLSGVAYTFRDRCGLLRWRFATAPHPGGFHLVNPDGELHYYVAQSSTTSSSATHHLSEPVARHARECVEANFLFASHPNGDDSLGSSGFYRPIPVGFSVDPGQSAVMLAGPAIRRPIGWRFTCPKDECQITVRNPLMPDFSR